MKKDTSRTKEKEVTTMITAARLCDNESQYLKDLDTYIEQLKMQIDNSPEDAYKEAKKALIRTGVMTRSGKLKKKIVSWE